MAAPTDAATPPSTPAAEDGTVAVLRCDGCRCPIGSLWDVLPAEETAPAWKRHVYSYELDLFNNGTAPVQAYSATNPSARRFDLLRLAPQVMVRRPAATAAPSTGPTAAPPAASTTVLAPAFVECDTAVYSTEHSFFTGYAWCFAHCGNCGAFLGWGFAAESRLRAAQQPAQEGHEQQQQQSNEGSSRLRERAERRAEADAEEAQEAQESGTHTRRSSSAAVRDDAAGSSSSPPREDASADAPNADAREDEGNDATSSGSAVCESNASPDVVHELVDAAAVTPDFIGIVITHCTGEPDYPVAALLRDVEWRAARTRRRSAVAALRQRLRVLLSQMADGYRAHQLYHDFSTVEQLMYAVPPGNEASVTSSSSSSTGGHSDSGTSTTASVMNAAVAALLRNVDADGVPMRLHAAVQSARISIARQRQPQNARNGTRARTRRSSTSSSGDSASEGSEGGSGSS